MGMYTHELVVESHACIHTAIARGMCHSLVLIVTNCIHNEGVTC